MTLLELATQLDDVSDEMTIYGQKRESKWYPESPVQLVHVPRYSEGDPAPPDGMTYLLEISLCKQVVQAYINHRGNKEPSGLEKARAIAYYAKNDAYLPVDRDRTTSLR